MALTRGLGAYDDGTPEEPGTGTTPKDVRVALAGLFTGPGVLPGGDATLVAGTAGMAYAVRRKHFVTQRSVGDGMQLFANDGEVTVGEGGIGTTVPPAPGAGLQRIDIIWVRHPTNAENGDTSSQPVFGVAVGDALSIPTPPSIPAGALEIGRNTMSAGATSTSSSGNSIAQSAAQTEIVRPVRNLRTAKGPSEYVQVNADRVLATVSVAMVAGRTYRLDGHFRGRRSTTGGNCRVRFYSNAPGYTQRDILNDTIPGGTPLTASAFDFLTATTTGTYGVQMIGSAVATGWMGVDEGSCQLAVTDVTY